MEKLSAESLDEELEQFHRQNPVSAEEFLAFYYELFARVGQIATVSEGAEDRDAPFSMSQWVEPSSIVTIVVRTPSVLSASLVESIKGVITRWKTDRVVGIDRDRGAIYIFPNGRIAATDNFRQGELEMLGLGGNGSKKMEAITQH